MNNESRNPLKYSEWNSRLASGDIAYSGLVTSLHSEGRASCSIRGEWPKDLCGSLFRTGPGLFERGGDRRRMVIDADGMMRHFSIDNGHVSFANKHIRTDKFIAEEKAGRYLYPTFAMSLSEGGLANSIANLKNQASVTTFFFGERLFATDEMQPVVEISPDTLEIMKSPLTFGNGPFKAHARITHFGSSLLHLAKLNPVTSLLQFQVYDLSLKRVRQTVPVKVTRNFHDWHVTPNYYVVLLPPAYLNKWQLAKALFGAATIGDAFQFRANEKAQLLVIPKNGDPATTIDLPEAFDSWHSINAFERDGQLVYDFIATPGRGSPVSDQSAMSRIMRGDLALNSQMRESQTYRAVIDLKSRSLASCFAHGPHGVEMPTIDARRAGLEHRDAFFIAGQEGVDSQLVRFSSSSASDGISDRLHEDRYDFGPGKFVTEPIFAPRSVRSNDSLGGGYLLSEVYSHAEKRSMLAVFDAFDLASGPIAEAWLDHHLPIGFHGAWVAR